MSLRPKMTSTGIQGAWRLDQDSKRECLPLPTSRKSYPPGGRTGRQSGHDELKRSSREAGWTGPPPRPPPFSIQRLAAIEMLPQDSANPRPGDYSGKTSPPSPQQITTVVTASLYKGFKTQLLGAPQLPPPTSSTSKSARHPTTRGQEHILSRFTQNKYVQP